MEGKGWQLEPLGQAEVWVLGALPWGPVSWLLGSKVKPGSRASLP